MMTRRKGRPPWFFTAMLCGLDAGLGNQHAALMSSGNTRPNSVCSSIPDYLSSTRGLGLMTRENMRVESSMTYERQYQEMMILYVVWQALQVEERLQWHFSSYEHSRATASRWSETFQRRHWARQRWIDAAAAYCATMQGGDR